MPKLLLIYSTKEMTSPLQKFEYTIENYSKSNPFFLSFKLYKLIKYEFSAKNRNSGFKNFLQSSRFQNRKRLLGQREKGSATKAKRFDCSFNKWKQKINWRLSEKKKNFKAWLVMRAALGGEK